MDSLPAANRFDSSAAERVKPSLNDDLDKDPQHGRSPPTPSEDVDVRSSPALAQEATSNASSSTYVFGDFEYEAVAAILTTAEVLYAQQINRCVCFVRASEVHPQFLGCMTY